MVPTAQDSSAGAHRPRNVDWKRAAALLYGDWGTSKAYVIGLAFVAAGFSSFPIILAVCALTGLVGINYAVICRYFPDGGGVYSAARSQSHLLAVVGALLLVADLTVTAALSGWSALSYFPIGIFSRHIVTSTVGLILLLGAVNYLGPKHSGSLALFLGLPTLLVVVVLIALSLPHLTLAHLEAPHESFRQLWIQFVGVILALSGVEAIANLTGVMKLDRDSTAEHPKVGREAAKAIWPVALEVVIGTALLGWAMLSLPSVLERNLGLASKEQIVALLDQHKEDMLRFMAEQFATVTFGPVAGHAFGVVVGLMFFLLLLSAANTALVALIGLMFMMARDGEMPSQFTQLTTRGVPRWPLALAVALPALVLVSSASFEGLAGLYAIGVVGAIVLNLGSCTFNKALPLHVAERSLFAFTFVLLFAVELTLAHEKHDALFFVICILMVGLALRAWTQKRSGLTTVTVPHLVAEWVSPASIAKLQPRLVEGQKIMVCARGITPVLRYALEEATLRQAVLCVLYVREVAAFISSGAPVSGRARWQDDAQAAAIMSVMLRAGEERGLCVLPVYAVSDDAAATIIDLSATMGVDYLLIGSSQRHSLENLLRGSVATSVARELPESIELIIFG